MVHVILIARKLPVPPVGNLIGQISLGRCASGRVMAADKIQRADQVALAAAIAETAFDPALTLAKNLNSWSRISAASAGRARP